MFKIVRVTDLPEYKGKGTLYVHDLSGMEVFHIKNDSKELTCNFAFATPSQDDTGVAHILEHTVLSGSERFPLKSPFDQVYLSSPNTLLNAMTFNDKTMYPFCSPLKKDFDILFDIYADAVFSPLLRKQSFEQEGVRFFGSKIDGVVYNEMTGALSSADDIMESKCMRKLFKGTPFMYESGGDPLYIADLTYEEYLNRYKCWYSPSNCRLFLFGDLDAEEYLDKLEVRYLNKENLKKYKGTKYITSASLYTFEQNSPVRDFAPCPQEDCLDMLLTWLTKPSENTLDSLTLSVLVDILLGNPGAPLYKAITDSGLGEDLNPLSGSDADFAMMPFMVGFTGAKEGSEDKVEDFILSTLKKIATEGLPEDQVNGAIKRQEFKIQEITGGSEPFGFNVSIKAARTWLRGKNPEDGIDNIGTLKKLKEKVSKGRYFENWILENIVNNPRRCLMTVKSDPCFNENLQKQLDAKHKTKKYSDSEKKAFEKFVATDDSEELLNMIPRIKVSDMPCEIPSYPMEEERYKEALLLKYGLYTRGIVYFNMAFSTVHLSQEEKRLVPLLVRLMQMTGTQKHDYVEIGSLIKNCTGSFYLGTMIGKGLDSSYSSSVVLRTKMLDCDVKDALNLVSEIVNTADVSDTQRINASITDLITEFEMNYTYGGSSYASLYACSQFSKVAKESDMNLGTSAWLYLNSIDKKNLAQRLVALKDKIFTRCGLTIQLGCDEENLEKNFALTKAFLDTINAGEEKSLSSFYSDDCEKNDKHIVLRLSSGPAYNALAFKLNNMSQKELTHALLYSYVMSNSFLWDIVRGRNGAYGVNSTVEMQEGIITFTSYRDPSVDKTFEAFEQAFEADVDAKKLEYATVSILGRELRPLTPQQKCNEAFKRFLYKMDSSVYILRRTSLLETKPEDIRAVMGKIKECFKRESYKTTVCGQETAKTINGNTQIIVLPA